MMKRFWVFILLTLAAGVVSAQDMPPLPSDAPASAAAKDAGMPALPDAAAAPASAASAATSDMPALPDAGAAAAPAKAAVSNDMPALPDAGAAAPAAASAAKDAGMPALPDAGAAAPAKSAAPAGDMPALPDAGGAAAAPAKSAAPAGDMPALPDAGGAAAPAAAPASKAPAEAAPAEAAPADAGADQAAAPKAKEGKPWTASKERPKTIFGGWIKARGGNITSRLSWASQQVLNALDAKKYKMSNEEGVYEGEQGKGPQFRKFTFTLPKSKDTVLVLLKESKGKVWLRVGPDEEPAFADHTYAQSAKIRAEDMQVLAIIKAKLGARVAPHRYVPSWDAPYNRHKETADE